jgi:hypothetical protein
MNSIQTDQGAQELRITCSDGLAYKGKKTSASYFRCFIPGGKANYIIY